MFEVQKSKKSRSEERRRNERFSWSPADVKVQDEQGNRIPGDEFLQRLYSGTVKNMEKKIGT